MSMLVRIFVYHGGAAEEVFFLDLMGLGWIRMTLMELLVKLCGARRLVHRAEGTSRLAF